MLGPGDVGFGFTASLASRRYSGSHMCPVLPTRPYQWTAGLRAV